MAGFWGTDAMKKKAEKIVALLIEEKIARYLVKLSIKQNENDKNHFKLDWSVTSEGFNSIGIKFFPNGEFSGELWLTARLAGAFQPSMSLCFGFADSVRKMLTTKGLAHLIRIISDYLGFLPEMKINCPSGYAYFFEWSIFSRSSEIDHFISDQQKAREENIRAFLSQIGLYN